HDRLENELYTHLAMGLDKGQEIRIAPDASSIAGHVFESGEIKNVPDVTQEPLFTGESDRKTGYETKNILAFPLVNRRGDRIGVFQLLNKKTDPGYFDQEDEAFLTELMEQIADLLDLILRKDELAHRNAILEEQMQQLSAFEYLVGDRTAINTVFKYNRKFHSLGGVLGMIFLILMAVTSLVMVRSPDLRSLMLGLHTGTEFGLGYQYYLYTDLVAILTLAVCLSGLLMYVYPPLNRWLKAKKERLVKGKLSRGLQASGKEQKKAN
ncbi:MAG: GAF domain-containing protein, partial [bacterium]|nr:GAF domain-containing protein [bacterium]